MSPAACKNCQQGKEEPEIPVPGLVPEEKHSGCAADAAAQDHCQKQGLFRDAPQVLFGTLLVDAHKGECDQIDCGKITQLQIQLHHYACPFWKRS